MDKLLRKNDAREMLNLPLSTFDEFVKDGLIPKPAKFGRIPVWRLSDIQGVIDKLFEANNEY